MAHAFPGVIVLWFGAIEDIPAGWALCDGNNGTPDLQNNFVRGAGDAFNPNDTGGSVAHNHTFTSNIHSHTLQPGGGPLGAGTSIRNQTDEVAVSGTTGAADSIPPFHALAYIMLL